MDNLQNSPSLIIHTIRGNKSIDEITTLDLAYEYMTANDLYIRGVKEFPESNIYKITLNDGRVEFYREDEYFPMSGEYGCMTICEILQVMERNHLSMSDKLDNLSIGFGPNHPIEKYLYKNEMLDPDAYIAGALLMYGDFNLEYINIPSDKLFFVDNLCYKHHMQTHSLGDGYISFKYKKNSNPIRWDEFFPSSIMKFINRESYDFPLEYLMGNKSNRIQFIRGIFDAGSIISPHEIYPVITNTSEYKLKSLQSMIWSIGATSSITKDSDSDIFRLTIFYPAKKISDLFYDVSKKEEFLFNIFKSKKYPLYIKTIISSIEFYGCIKSKGLITDYENSLYLTGQFVPKFSVI